MTTLTTTLALLALGLALRTCARRITRGGLVRVARVLPELLEQDLDLLGQRNDPCVLFGDPRFLLGDPRFLPAIRASCSAIRASCSAIRA